MENIIRLLEDKNEHLEKFYQLNETELVNFANGNYDNLEIFYQSRETILDLIRCIDGLVGVSTQNSQIEKSSISEEHKRKVISVMNKKNDLVTQILAQDLQILSVIEQAKSDIIRELNQVKMSRKAVSAYKSGDPESKLNEKA